MGHREQRSTGRTVGGRTRLYAELFPREGRRGAGLACCVLTPSRVPHPWGVTSCKAGRQAAPRIVCIAMLRTHRAATTCAHSPASPHPPATAQATRGSRDPACIGSLIHLCSPPRCWLCMRRRAAASRSTWGASPAPRCRTSLLASPRELIASPSNFLASPSELLPAPRCRMSRASPCTDTAPALRVPAPASLVARISGSSTALSLSLEGEEVEWFESLCVVPTAPASRPPKLLVPSSPHSLHRAGKQLCCRFDRYWRS